MTRKRSVNVEQNLLTTDASEILNDPEIQIVVELIGGYEPARTLVLEALRQGKHVVTANKALLANTVHGRELLKLHNSSTWILVEASVGGGMEYHAREGLVAK